MTHPCTTRTDIYDALHDDRADPETVEAARHHCATCPIQPECWAQNRGEQWVAHLEGRALAREKHAHLRRAEHERRRQARREEIEHLLGFDAALPEILRSLGITREALWKWCHLHAPDLWRRINPPPPAAVMGDGWRTGRRRRGRADYERRGAA